jgi:hypothetical protein
MKVEEAEELEVLVITLDQFQEEQQLLFLLDQAEMVDQVNHKGVTQAILEMLLLFIILQLTVDKVLQVVLVHKAPPVQQVHKVVQEVLEVLVQLVHKVHQVVLVVKAQ